eukprot:TRINITY_DN9546_c0_g1_i3.p2 TRINITY_DN9546_c0_g1~~TRINITY_DN9546_c0_g1_i3.p2  ORF type:complete len:223 (-),score=49.68 TRINITY_DN9546_c0_g1_i3:395-1063(-)
MRQGSVKELKKGKEIYVQGEVSGSVYVILRGTVESHIICALFGYEPVLVDTLHEGDHFGEMQALEGAEAPVRQTTCICATSCLLLQLPARVLSEKLRETINSKCSAEIQLLKGIKYFSELTEIELLHILKSSQKREYKYGEHILREQDHVRAMHIIISGQCRVGVKAAETRSLKGIAKPDRLLEEVFVPAESAENGAWNLCSIKEVKDGCVTYENMVCCWHW